MSSLLQNKILQKKIGMLLAMILFIATATLAPYSYTAEKNEALALIVFDPTGEGSRLVNNALNTITSSAAAQGLIRDGLNGIAWKLAKKAMSQITANTVQWINSGFKGSPAFITDLNGFLADVADQVAGDFIAGSELGLLCSPFQLDIRIALDFQVQQFQEKKFQCTLSGVVNNVENYFNGDFLGNGGWASWIQMTSRPANNPYGALVLAQGELGARISSATGEKSVLLDWGRGLLSMEKCDDVQGSTKQKCKIVTPGSVIQEALTFDLSSGKRSLIEADEVNEIVVALFSQLTQQAMTSANGLLGLSQSGYGGSSSGGSYLDDLYVGDDDFDGVPDQSNYPVSNALDVEKELLALYEGIRDDLIDVREYWDDLNDNDVNGQCAGSFSSSLENTLDETRTDVSDAAFTVLRLESLRDQAASTTDPIIEQEIYRELQILFTQGLIHNEVDVVLLEFDRNDIVDDIGTFRRRIDQRCTETDESR